MVKLANTVDLKSTGESLAGSSPATGTTPYPTEYKMTRPQSQYVPQEIWYPCCDTCQKMKPFIDLGLEWNKPQLYSEGIKLINEHKAITKHSVQLSLQRP